jgi:hypothetical protein
VIALAILAVGSSSSVQAQSAGKPPGTEHARAFFGRTLAAIHDVDGDGVNDLAVGAPAEGSVSIVSLGKGVVLERIAGAEPRRGFASVLSVLGDMDGDGIGELAVSSLPSASVTILAGATFKSLRHQMSPSTAASTGEDRFGASCAAIGDCDEDGVLDYIVGMPEYWDDKEPRVSAWLRSTYGAAAIFSGKSGTFLRQLVGPGPVRGSDWTAWSAFGSAVADLGADLDGDGRSEVIVVAPGALEESKLHSQVSVCSPATGATLATSSGTPDTEEYTSPSIALMSDVDGDGVREVAVGSPARCVNVFSGRTLRLLHTVSELDPGGYSEGFGASISAVGDQNGDGLLDLVVGCQELGDVGDDYYFALFSGKDGKLLRRQRTDRKQVSVCAVGDLNKDERADIAVGFFELDLVRVYSYSPRSSGGGGGWTCIETIRALQGTLERPRK